jgi:methylmalonyl-CoA mutase N-terminal domain/subunit
VKTAIANIKYAAENQQNLMPHLIDASLKYVTLSEMTGILREVFGVYKETVVF